jgi:VWFA-related protein
MKRTPLLMTVVILILTSSNTSALWQKDRQVEIEDQNVVTVIRKLIHVIVTDRKGDPITDLRMDEFVLYDNGREKTITEFENHTLSLPPEERRPPEAEPIKEAPAPEAPLMNRTFFFLFDFVFADPGGVRLARQAALRFFEADLEPEDEIGVLSFSGGRSLNVLHLPDRDRAAARHVIESIGLRNLRPIAPIRPIGEPRGRIRTSTSPDDAHSRGFESEPAQYNVKLGRIVAGNFIWALDTLAQALRYAPGRKVIVLYSNGLNPTYIGREATMQLGNSDLGRAYQNLCRNLSTAGVSVFTINTEENTFLVNATPDSRKGVASLREIASETGGRHLGDLYAAPDHVEQIETLTGAYYVLGYPIAESWDGRFHKIRVKVTRPGCKVNAQSGYYNAKPFPDYSKLEKQIHLVDLALSEKPMSQEPIRFAVQALPWAPAQPGNIRFVAEIPVERLEEVSGPRIEVVSLVFNDLDQVVDTHRVECDFTRPEYKEKPVFCLSDLSAPPGTYKCRFVLRNLDTGRAAVAASSTIIPKADSKGLLLYPPLFLISGGPSVCLNVGTVKNKRTTHPHRDSPADFARGFPVDAEKYVPLCVKLLASGSEILAVIKCAVPEKSASDLALSASLKNLTNGFEFRVPLQIKAQKTEKDGRAFCLQLEIPTVLPGTYHLELSAEAQGATSRVVKVFRID